MAGRARIGIAGWKYDPWNGTFYPSDLAKTEQLRYASASLDTIEINASFYGLQQEKTWVSWRSQTPDDFVFAVKGPQEITHRKSLRNVAPQLKEFFASGLLQLGSKLGPVLWQLPPSLEFDERVIREFLDQLPRTVADIEIPPAESSDALWEEEVVELPSDTPIRHAVEVRHARFNTPVFLRLLAEYGVASVVTDTPNDWPRFHEPVGDFVYARMHGDPVRLPDGYDESTLNAWATRVTEWADDGRDVFVYFADDVKERSPHDALGLKAKVGYLSSAAH